MSLTANCVSVIRNGRHLVRAVSLTVNSGEFLIVMGPNGAGKSTLLKTLAAEIKPDSGEIFLNGLPLAAIRGRERAKQLAVLPQDHHIEFHFTALEIALFGRHPHCGGFPSREDERLAAAALERLDAGNLAQRFYPSLSGGEQARVQLARVLAQVWEPEGNAPRYLLLDEPIASLDIAHQHQALRIIREFAASRQVGVIAILHDLNIAAQFGDRIALLKNGSIVDTGAPDSTFTVERLSECFGVDAIVLPHPRGNSPLVVVAGG
ncbi:MAG: heme ABC transporter ATP-binding protein [Burkholderiales bacterium]